MSARLFLAIPIDDISREAFSKFQDNIDNPPKGLRWIDRKNWHITLLFLGNNPENKIPEVKRCFQKQLEPINPFSLKFEKYRLIFRNKNPSMLWAQYHPQEQLNLLVQNLHATISKVIELEKLRAEFLPHVTLARIKKTADKRKISWKSAPVPQDLIAQRLILYRSELTPDGAIYTPLDSYNLKNPIG